MVEVFKTNVEEAAQANRLVALLLEYFPGGRINFDLDDCDRILRVEEKDVMPGPVIALLNANGYQCYVLD